MIFHKRVDMQNVAANTTEEERVWIEEAQRRSAKYIVVVIDDFFLKGEQDPEYAQDMDGVGKVFARTQCDKYSYIDYTIELC